VQRALDLLVAQGIVETRPGIGSFAAESRSVARADTAWQDVALGPSRVDAATLANIFAGSAEGVLQMGAGYVDPALRPDERLSQAMARAARRPGVWDKPPLRGVAELRTWFAGQTGADPDDVIVTPAAQGSLSAVLRALASAGEPVLFATPAYPGALAVARSAGLIPVGVPTDGDGVRPDLLEQALARTGSRVLYTQPTFANPDGSVLARDRRAALLDLAHRYGAVIVEDDWARWLGHHGALVPPPLLTDDRYGHVVTICSLTKVAAPALRIGAVIARGPVQARIADMRLVDDFFVPTPLQLAAVELVSGAAWKTHTRSLSAQLAARCAATAAALRAELPDGCEFAVPGGGISLWTALPAGISDDQVAHQAALRKLFVMPGRHYEIDPPVRSHLRLSFAALPERDAPEAATRLAAAVMAAAGG
jgi:DNA-binding transcriptional MocR family regulator